MNNIPLHCPKINKKQKQPPEKFYKKLFLKNSQYSQENN